MQLVHLRHPTVQARHATLVLLLGAVAAENLKRLV